MNAQPSPVPDAEAERPRFTWPAVIALAALVTVLVTVFAVPQFRAALLAWFPGVIFPPFVEIFHVLAYLGHLIGGLF